MKTLMQMLLFALIAVVGGEAFWLNSSPAQRGQWLSVLPLSTEQRQLISSERQQPLLAQLWFARPSSTPATAANSLDNASAQPGLADSGNFHSAHNHAAHAYQHQHQSLNANPGSRQAGISRLRHAFALQHCVKPPTQTIDNVERASIYRWKDAHGRVHFGDKPGAKKAKDMSRDYQHKTQGVKLSLDYPDWDGDASLSATLKREANLMYRILTQYIPRPHWRQINLNLMIFPSQGAFETFKQKQQANPGWMAYYDGEKNQAYLAVQEDEKITLQIARHEMAHAMMSGMLGTLPIWINEGMAQYLERLNWQMSSAWVPADVANFTQLAAIGPGGFSELAGMDHYEFNGYGQDQHYVRASAMMHFLLGHHDGKRWLKNTFRYYAQNPCSPFDAEEFFNQGYHSGLAGVSKRYRRWLERGDYPAHYY